MFSCFFHQNIAFQSHIFHSPITFLSPKGAMEPEKQKLHFVKKNRIMIAL